MMTSTVLYLPDCLMPQSQVLYFSMVCCCLFLLQPAVTAVTKPICTLPSLRIRRNSAVGVFLMWTTLVHISLKWEDVGACRRNSETDVNTVWMEMCVCVSERKTRTRVKGMACSSSEGHHLQSIQWWPTSGLHLQTCTADALVTPHPLQPKARRGPAALSSPGRAETSKCLHRKSINTWLLTETVNMFVKRSG